MSKEFRQIAAVSGTCVALVAMFTVIASGVLLYLIHSLSFFTFPFNQWWIYTFRYWGIWNISVWTKLLTAMFIGLMPLVLIIKIVGRRAGFFITQKERYERGI